MLRLGVLGSGSGTNLQAILNATEWGGLKVEVVCVMSDVEDAFILERARNHEVPAYAVDCGPSRSKLEGAAEQRVLDLLKEHKADAVALAGFMRIVKQGVIEAFPNKVVNIHPSLLPAFVGLNAQRQALEHGVKITGATVHLRVYCPFCRYRRRYRAHYSSEIRADSASRHGPRPPRAGPGTGTYRLSGSPAAAGRGGTNDR